MPRSRPLLAAPLAVLMAVGAVGGGLAQDETADIPADATPVAPIPQEVAQPGGDLPGDPRVQLVRVADGLTDPVNVDSPNDGSGRLFVAERPGRIRVVQDGQLLEEPFLDISNQVLDAFLEQGLYAMAFHPDYAENGRFFVHFAELLRNGDSVIVEYRVSPDNPNKADPESARLLMQVDQPWANHNGGEIVFGPDGYLYIGIGDGGWEGDPLEAGQNLATPLGKLLRIDVDTATTAPDQADEGGEALPGAVAGVRPYGIPPDNPFAEAPQLVELFGIPEEVFAEIHTGAQPEIWDYGLRNPYEFSFDRETGDLYIGEVGQNHWEEIDFAPAGYGGGVNWGWDFLMGSHCFPIEQEACALVGVLPAAEYPHSVGCAVIGGHVYRGEAFPALGGIYFAADYCSGRVFGLARDDTNTWQFEELLQTDLRFTGSGEAEDGDIYFTSCECHYGTRQPEDNPPGALWRLVQADQVPEGATTAPAPSGAATPAADGTPEAGHEHQHGAETATPEAGA